MKEILKDKDLCVSCSTVKRDCFLAQGMEKTYACVNYEDKGLNLCDTCTYCIATCDSEHLFGNGVGNDNVYRCSSYKKIEKNIINDK